jgi:hypothetical protein
MTSVLPIHTLLSLAIFTAAPLSADPTKGKGSFSLYYVAEVEPRKSGWVQGTIKRPDGSWGVYRLSPTDTRKAKMEAKQGKWTDEITVESPPKLPAKFNPRSPAGLAVILEGLGYRVDTTLDSMMKPPQGLEKARGARHGLVRLPTPAPGDSRSGIRNPNRCRLPMVPFSGRTRRFQKSSLSRNTRRDSRITPKLRLLCLSER